MPSSIQCYEIFTIHVQTLSEEMVTQQNNMLIGTLMQESNVEKDSILDTL